MNKGKVPKSLEAYRMGRTSPSSESCPSKCGFDKARNYGKFLLCGDRWHTSPSPVPAKPRICPICGPDAICDHLGWEYDPDTRLAEIRQRQPVPAGTVSQVDRSVYPVPAEPLPERYPAGGMIAPKRPHLRVWEYDGAFKCLDCKAQWGALDGKPQMPATCMAAQAETTPSTEPLSAELFWKQYPQARQLLTKWRDGSISQQKAHKTITNSGSTMACLNFAEAYAAHVSEPYERSDHLGTTWRDMAEMNAETLKKAMAKLESYERRIKELEQENSRIKGAWEESKLERIEAARVVEAAERQLAKARELYSQLGGTLTSENRSRTLVALGAVLRGEAGQGSGK